MFTGIIKELGTLRKKEEKDGSVALTIHAPSSVAELKIGDSVAVNGVCLTVEEISDGMFLATAVPETLSRTNLGTVKIGGLINIEPALRAGNPISGHFVAGHIDCVGRFLGLKTVGGGTVMSVSFPADIAKFLAIKGSVAVNGVSLTIASLANNRLGVALIPYTKEHTNLGALEKDEPLNIEVDLIARYLSHLTNS